MDAERTKTGLQFFSLFALSLASILQFLAVLLMRGGTFSLIDAAMDERTAGADCCSYS